MEHKIESSNLNVEELERKLIASETSLNHEKQVLCLLRIFFENYSIFIYKAY